MLSALQGDVAFFIHDSFCFDEVQSAISWPTIAAAYVVIAEDMEK